MSACAAPAVFPYHHRTVAQIAAAEARQDAIRNRPLIRALLEHHSIVDVHAMMQLTVSGRKATLEHVRAVRKVMLAEGAVRRPKNVPMPHLRPDPPAPEPVVAAIERQPIIVQAVPVKRRPPAAPETFESQMARLAAGARLVAAPDLRTGGPTYTLGGIASAML